MIKEAGLFIISTGFLIYFISPVQKEQEPPPAKIEAKQKAVSATNDDSDYWGEEEHDEEADGQEFVFGEPMMSTEPFGEIDYSDSYDEESQSDDRKLESEPTPSPNVTTSRTAKSRRIHSSSPKPGELGSAENPIPFN